VPRSGPVDDREGRPGSVNKGPDRLKGKYYDLDQTALTATVEAKANELSPFPLQSK